MERSRQQPSRSLWATSAFISNMAGCMYYYEILLSNFNVQAIKAETQPVRYLIRLCQIPRPPRLCSSPHRYDWLSMSLLEATTRLNSEFLLASSSHSIRFYRKFKQWTSFIPSHSSPKSGISPATMVHSAYTAARTTRQSVRKLVVNSGSEQQFYREILFYYGSFDHLAPLPVPACSEGPADRCRRWKRRLRLAGWQGTGALRWNALCDLRRPWGHCRTRSNRPPVDLAQDCHISFDWC